MIPEKFLHFIWQFQYFNKGDLFTEDGEALQIIHQGIQNFNQGPDFKNATIKLGNITLAGNIELHALTSQFIKHQHQNDKNYKNLILHVVWENDIDLANSQIKTIPTLILKGRIPKYTLDRHFDLMQSSLPLPCSKHLPALNSLGWTSWKESLAAQRLQEKSKKVLSVFKTNNNNWEETFWQLLAYNFGLKVNADFFEQMATSVPVIVLAKHKNSIHQLEAILLGQANLLNKPFKNKYAQLLQKEYLFLKKKHSFSTLNKEPYFLRMRPANFPSVRLAQLAMLVFQCSHLFSHIKEKQQLKEVQQMFNVTANDYWNYHYTLYDEETTYKPKKLGKAMVDSIIINTLIPVLFAYGLYSKEEQYKEKTLRWLAELKPEKNSITNNWEALNISNKTAFDSQALIQLSNAYCKQKKCLECAVGNKILKPL